MAVTLILDFQKFEILMLVQLQGPMGVTMLNFYQNRSNDCEDIAIYRTSKWRSSAILDLLNPYLDHPWRVLSGLYHCAKFGGIDGVVFIICQFLYLRDDLKMSIRACKMRVVGAYNP